MDEYYEGAGEPSKEALEEEKRLGCDEFEKKGLYNLDSVKVGGTHQDYFGSLHHKIVSSLDK